MDRDLNAAINLLNYKEEIKEDSKKSSTKVFSESVPQGIIDEKYAVSATVKVCGDAKFHAERQVGVRETEIKQQICHV